MKHIDILNNATKIHTPDGVYDGEAAHWSLCEIDRLREELIATSSHLAHVMYQLNEASDEIELLQSENEMLEDLFDRETER